MQQNEEFQAEDLNCMVKATLGDGYSLDAM